MIQRCDEIAGLLFTNWDKYYPIILKMSDGSSEYDALLTIDKKLRPHGSQSSAPGAFSFHKVSLVHITSLAPFVHLVLHVHEISAEMNTTLLHNKNAFSNVRLNLIT